MIERICGCWTIWEERGLVLPLQAGINRITLQSDTAEGGPNFDYLKLCFTDEPVAEPYDPDAQTVQPPVSAHPTVFVASDSTAQTYKESYKPQQGCARFCRLAYGHQPYHTLAASQRARLRNLINIEGDIVQMPIDFLQPIEINKMSLKDHYSYKNTFRLHSAVLEFALDCVKFFLT